jgi:putative intracellular protease/amidase
VTLRKPDNSNADAIFRKDNEKAADWQSFVTVDGRLVMGQNPAYSTAAAKTLHNQEPAFKGSSRKENFQ